MTVVLAIAVIAAAIVVIVIIARAAAPRAAVRSVAPAETNNAESVDAWLVPRDDVVHANVPTGIPTESVAASGPADPIEAVAAGPAAAAHVSWPQRITGDVAELDDAARIRLLTDLGIVRAPWCVPVLLLACEEEHDPTVRRAALTALGGFRASADARIALEHAVAANDAEEFA